MTRSALPRPSLRPRLTVAAILVVSAALIVVTALHLTASSAARRSQTGGSLAEKTEAAQLAARLEPWNGSFTRLEHVLRLWTEGEQLLGDGDYNAALETLRKAYVDDVGNSELLALFKRAQAVQALATNKKAHLQHGHEGPGGTLRPEDIER